MEIDELLKKLGIDEKMIEKSGLLIILIIMYIMKK